MRKYLRAVKVKDGWSIKITETHYVSCESDIYDLIRYEGLKLSLKTYKEIDGKQTDELKTIFAS